LLHWEISRLDPVENPVDEPSELPASIEGAGASGILDLTETSDWMLPVGLLQDQVNHL